MNIGISELYSIDFFVNFFNMAKHKIKHRPYKTKLYKGEINLKNKMKANISPLKLLDAYTFQSPPPYTLNSVFSDTCTDINASQLCDTIHYPKHYLEYLANDQINASHNSPLYRKDDNDYCVQELIPFQSGQTLSLSERTYEQAHLEMIINDILPTNKDKDNTTEERNNNCEINSDTVQPDNGTMEIENEDDNSDVLVRKRQIKKDKKNKKKKKANTSEEQTFSKKKNKKRKKRNESKTKRGDKVEREIRREQKDPRPAMRYLPFQRLVKEIATTISPSIRFRSDAVGILHLVVENKIVENFEDGDLCMKTAKRKTLQVKDLHLAEKLRLRKNTPFLEKLIPL